MIDLNCTIPIGALGEIVVGIPQKIGNDKLIVTAESGKVVWNHTTFFNNTGVVAVNPGVDGSSIVLTLASGSYIFRAYIM